MAKKTDKPEAAKDKTAPDLEQQPQQDAALQQSDDNAELDQAKRIAELEALVGDLEADNERLNAENADLKEATRDAATRANNNPDEFPLRLRRDAALGNGNRKRGFLVGRCERHPAVPVTEVFEAIVDSRFTREELQDDGSVVISYSQPKGTRQAGDTICRLIPEPDATVRECVNALRNPVLIGR